MKIIRAYAVAVIICLSITSIISGIFIADENARRITLGEGTAVVVISSDDERVNEGDMNISPALEMLKNSIKKAAGFAPPPISNIYWLIEKIR